MRVFYSPQTRADLREAIRTSQRDGTVFTKVTGCNVMAKIVVLYLTDSCIPFKVVAMGAGVKKITTDVTICPKCRGLGKC